MPQRLSAKPIEEQKPSRIIAAFWWAAFIIPVIFTYVAFKSWELIALLLFLRVALMAVQSYTKRKEPKKVKEVKVEPEPDANLNTKGSPLTPYIEEAKDEWYGLLRFLHIYDKYKEEKYLGDYRRIRGWDK
jgi:hypothetical protein